MKTDDRGYPSLTLFNPRNPPESAQSVKICVICGFKKVSVAALALLDKKDEFDGIDI
jgi:hypothetical protein